MSQPSFDVFFCHDSRDKAAVERIERRLRRRGLQPWLDARQLRPGLPWQRELEAQLKTVGAAAVFVGTEGGGPWQELEIEALLRQFVERGCPVIPVILPECEDVPDLPVFLAGMTWVDFRLELPDPLEQLIWGITGDSPEPSYLNDETRELSESLDKAYRRKAEIEAEGGDAMTVVQEILGLRRRLRQGAQLKAGDYLDDRFQLLQAIGYGGFAHVWKAWDRRRRQLVAVKVLHGQHTGDASRRERFFRGARQMARLRHPNVVQVIEEACEDGEYRFFVMEYLGGGDFRQAVRDGRLSQDQRLEVILEIGDALAFAHGRGVVHRDVKPHNILLAPDITPKLTDFDLVRAADTTGGTRTTMLGTFLYAAPEAMVNAKQAGAPADIYALGMTAVFALHGADLPSDVLWELPEIVDGLGVSEASRRVLLRALARKVDERWETVEAFCDAFQQALAMPTTPEPQAAQEPRPAPGAAPAPSPGVVRERVHEKDGSVLVYVPEGAFTLGTNEDLGAYSGQYLHLPKPEHRVELSEYWIGKYPVTNAQYRHFVEATGHREARYWDDKELNQPTQPVVGVSWAAARAYCAWAGLELPSEAEWEAAARGTDGKPYPWGKKAPSDSLANYDGRKTGTTPVGAFPDGAGPYGTLDQAGNVWEWCVDAWDEQAYRDRDGERDPVVTPEDEGGEAAGRVARGGSWQVPSRYLLAAVRSWYPAGVRVKRVGFRVSWRFDPEP